MPSAHCTATLLNKCLLKYYRYFDGRGFAEVPRTLFATVGRFAGEGFTDVRLNDESFPALRDTGESLSLSLSSLKNKRLFRAV